MPTERTTRVEQWVCQWCDHFVSATQNFQLLSTFANNNLSIWYFTICSSFEQLKINASIGLPQCTHCLCRVNDEYLPVGRFIAMIWIQR
uniref:Uncharacterized protein n=1 Tax=Globodera rostochiensis TaxID=31243 RepID=A0A914H119_GLORO